MSFGPNKRSMRTQTRRPGEHEGYHHESSGMGHHRMVHHHLSTDRYNGHSSLYQSQHSHSSHHQHHRRHHQVDNLRHYGGSSSHHPVAGTSRSFRQRTSGGPGHSQYYSHHHSSSGGGSSGKGSSRPTASSAGYSSAAAGTSKSQQFLLEDDSDDGNCPKSKNLEVVLTVDEMMNNCLFYLFLLQHKKHPIKSSDMIKASMPYQAKQFPEVLAKLEETLIEVFGFTLIKIAKNKDNQPYQVSGLTPPEDGELPMETNEEANAVGRRLRGLGGISFILTTKFHNQVFDSSMRLMDRRDPEADYKKAALYLILATIFMLNRSIDEDTIWKIIRSMEFTAMVCERREDLRKFLKSEYVTPLYLVVAIDQQDPNMAKKDDKTPGTDVTDLVKAKYLWGPRSNLEFSKYSMLKFVAARFHGRKMYEFTVQYNVVQRDEKDLIENDIFEEDDDTQPGSSRKIKRADKAGAAANGSAIQIKQAEDGKGETFAIDGDIETETEVE